MKRRRIKGIALVLIGALLMQVTVPLPEKQRPRNIKLLTVQMGQK